MKAMKRIILVVLVLVPLVGLIDAGLEIHRVMRVPSLNEWKAAADTVRQGYKKGDIVHFRPYWADEGERYFTGMDIDVLQELDWNELSTYHRVWIVATMSGLPFHVPPGFKPLMVKKQRRIEVYLLQPERAGHVVFDLIKGLHSARVTRIYPHRTQQCTLFKDHHWYCGSVHPWQFVGELVRDVVDGPRRVIWAHPLNHGNKIEVLYPNVPAGRQLEVDYGWSQRAVESDHGQAVHFQVYTDRKLAISTVLRKKNHKWNRLLIKLNTKVKQHRLRFVIWTRNYQDRQFCFKGWVFR